MIALRRAILMKANPVVSLHAHLRLVQRSRMLMQKRPLLDATGHEEMCVNKLILWTGGS